MPLSKLVFKPGINRDQTNYASEGGWYECDKIRFRSGFPEKLGGWLKYSYTQFVGVCRSLFVWVTSDGNNLMGVATNKKVYVDVAGNLFDITPVRAVFTSFPLTGVSSTGSVGTVQAIEGIPVFSVSATGQVGTVQISISISGVSSTGSVGTVGVQIT
jgi:hypothetical protein